MPRKLLEWREPPAVVCWRDREERRRLTPATRPLAALAVAGVCLLLWVSSRDLPGRQPLPAWAVFPLALGTGVLFTYVLPALLRRFPSYAWISEAAVSQTRGNALRHRFHGSLAAFGVISKELEGGRWSLLVLTGKEGLVTVIGLSSDLDLEEVRNVLQERGLTAL